MNMRTSRFLPIIILDVERGINRRGSRVRLNDLLHVYHPCSYPFNDWFEWSKFTFKKQIHFFVIKYSVLSLIKLNLKQGNM